MRALVTNDDGVASPGLHALAAAALKTGWDVVVAAPFRESSGSSASLTALEADGCVVTERREIPDLSQVPVYAVRATPAFIVFTAVRGAFGPIDLVLSGINRGPNTGTAVLHSGTVGAAMTAASHDRPAMAVSLLAGEGDPHWETACDVVAPLLAEPQQLRRGTVLNVNVPDVPFEQLRGVRQAPLAKFGAVQLTIKQVGEGFIRVAMQDVEPDTEHTDASLLAAGYSTVTALRLPCEAEDFAFATR